MPNENPGMRELMLRAWNAGTAIPSFNVPYLPMMEPIVRALRDTRCFALISVARLEWMKFEARGVREIFDEYQRVKDERFTRLHLDHVPVIDEDQLPVDYLAKIGEAVDLGYASVMVDGSRLSLDENIAATRAVVELAHRRDVPVEAELGAVLGHESGPMPPYEELFTTGKGFTDPAEARRFVEESGVDWLSVAVGSVHGSISIDKRNEKKVVARLSIERLDALRAAANVPLVLHGGSGIRKEYIQESFKHGIAKINVGTAVRQPYEKGLAVSLEKARQAAYDTTVEIVRNELALDGSVDSINP